MYAYLPGVGKKNEPNRVKPKPIQTEPKSISNHLVEYFSSPNG